MFGFLAQMLAWCYSLVPNYALAIALFTIILYLLLTPLNIKGMRSMAEMSRLQPEMKRLQDQYKNDRVKLNEEMQALFKEHKVNPLGGCLPTLLPFPVLIVMFRLLEHLTGRHTHHIFDPRRVLNTLPDPHYLSKSSSLYTHLVHDGGKMVSFGMDLGKSANSSLHQGVATAAPYYLLIALMTASQYVMQQQLNKRNPQAAAANPQMKLTMQLFPAFYALISLRLPASVVLYLLISGVFRMAQNIISYKYDPKLALPPLSGSGVIDATGRPKDGGGRGPALGGGPKPGKDGGPKPGKDGGPKPGRGGDGRNGGTLGRKILKGANGKGEDADAPDDRGVGAPKGAVNVRRPSSGRVTPRGGDGSRSRRGR